MDQEEKRHWLEFWLAADNYRSQWTSPNAASDALIIYNKQVSLFFIFDLIYIINLIDIFYSFRAGIFHCKQLSLWD